MIIRIDQEIGYWGISARDIKQLLSEATGDITIEINSPGGSVIEGIVIHNALKDYDKGQVTIIIQSYAASMATYIAMAGDVVKAYDNTIFMIHNPWNVIAGDYRDSEKNALVLRGMTNILKRAYVSKSNRDESTIQNEMDNETYFFGQELLTNGFVDDIISTQEEKDESSAKALVSETFKECMQNVRNNEKVEDFEQMAALAKDINFDSKDSSLVENPSASAGKTEKKEEEYEDMAKDSQNPDATITAEASTVAADAVANERKRVQDIMALVGDSEVKNKAITDGLSVGDAAIQLNASYAAQSKTQKNDFESAAEEVAQVVTDETKEVDADAKAWADAEKAKYGKGE